MDDQFPPKNQPLRAPHGARIVTLSAVGADTIHLHENEIDFGACQNTILHKEVQKGLEAISKLVNELIEEFGLELLVIYHSHPNGTAHPSPSDISQFFYPGVYSLILFTQLDSWSGRLYQIYDETYTEIPLAISSDA